MNGVIGMTELALDTDLQRISASTSTRSSSRRVVMLIINDILDFSKIEPQVILDDVAFSSGGCWRHDQAAAVRADQKGLECSCRSTRGALSLRGDPGRLRR